MQMTDETTQRLGESLQALNARIARLAMALDVALNDRAAVEAVMAKLPEPAPAQERRATTAPRVTSERRQAFQRQELRGLLLLRYHLETTSLTDNGWVVTHQAMCQAEQHLLSHGFKPGADGLGLDDFFDLGCTHAGQP